MSYTDDLVTAIQGLNAADRALLLSKMQDVSASEQKVGIEKIRAAAIKAASNDPSRAVAYKSSMRGLRRLGLDLDRLVASADPLNELNDALSKAKWTFTERVELKTSLAGIGAID